MFLTERYLNQFFSRYIDALESREVHIKTFVRGMGRLFSKEDPTVMVIDDTPSLTGYPKEATYRGPRHCVIKITRLDKSGVEYCVTRVVEMGTISPEHKQFIEKVTNWQFVGTDRWNKKKVINEDPFMPTPTVVYEQDDEELDDDIQEDNIPFSQRVLKGKSKGIADGLVVVFANALCLEDTSKTGSKVYTEVLVPFDCKPNAKSELIKMKDGMLVLLIKHVNIASGEKILYKKVVFPELYHKHEVDNIQRVGKWE